MSALVISFSVTAYSKGHPSGIWAKILPQFMHGWFTWPRTEVGQVVHTQTFPLPTAPRLVLAGGALEITVDPDFGGASIIVAGFAFDHIDFPVINGIFTGPTSGSSLPIQLTGGGFEVDGTLSFRVTT